MTKPFYQDNTRTFYSKDSRNMSELADCSVDLLATDPPYGIFFMGKHWDKALPAPQIWRECFRVLKPGSFAFVMSIPRADCLSRMIISLENAGFLVNFTPIFWTYATGYPKATNVSKSVDKMLGVERTDSVPGGHRGVISGIDGHSDTYNTNIPHGINSGHQSRGTPVSERAKELDGSYAGFQPKPAVEVVIVAMKPLSERNYIEQAMKNGKGITWLDAGRIPFTDEQDVKEAEHKNRHADFDSSVPRENNVYGQDKRLRREQGNYSAAPGRFPANLLVSDDVLGSVTDKGTKPHKANSHVEHYEGFGTIKNRRGSVIDYGDAGSFSRYFDLDAWWAKTFPFLIVSKASQSEKNKFLDMPRVVKTALPLRDGSGDYVKNEFGDGSNSTMRSKMMNYHPTVKPVKLMSYLITLGSREGDIILDNFAGTGTTAIAASLLNRRCVLYEIKREYCEIAVGRCRQMALEMPSESRRS